MTAEVMPLKLYIGGGYMYTSAGYIGRIDGILYPTEAEAREADPNN